MSAREPDEFMREVIDPACAALTGIMGREMGDDRARTMLLAIALQESELEHRRQIRGPARGYWQFERSGGTAGVLNHERSKEAAEAICESMGVEATPGVVYEALASDDNLAACFARLLLWTDPRPLPAIGDENDAWATYLRNWRPGKPHRARWSKCHAIAANTSFGGQLPGTAVAVVQDVATVTTKPSTPATLTTTGGTKAVTVEMPKMNRSWATGEFWLTVVASAAALAVQLSPIIDPAFDSLAENPAIAASPIAAVLFAVARQWYKAQRMKYAAQVASSETSPPPTATVVGTVT